jgi:hypothetical protein
MRDHRLFRAIAIGLLFSAYASMGFGAAPDSKRLAQAKDLIADEQWPQAVEVLRAAASDPKEPNRDEALFWLAHSQHQVRDTLGALETIQRLERDYRASRWVKPARSLRIEIAQRQRRNDVLWYTAAPPPPPAPPEPVPAAPPAPPAAAAPRAVPTPRPAMPPAAPASPAPAPSSRATSATPASRSA